MPASASPRPPAPSGPSRPLSRARFARAVTAALRAREMTQGDLAAAIGAAQPTVSDGLSQKKTPSPRYARAVLEALAHDWADVEGDDAAGLPDGRRSGGGRLSAFDLEAADVVLVPRHGHVSAGHGADNGDGDADGTSGDGFPDDGPAVEAYSRHPLRRLSQHNPDDLRACTVTGDSMEPVLRPNDTVVYAPVTAFGDAGMYVFRLDEAHFVKFVQRLGGGALDVIPHNERYSRERFLPVPYPDEADTPNTYRSAHTGLTATIEPVGKVVLYNQPA